MRSPGRDGKRGGNRRTMSTVNSSYVNETLNTTSMAPSSLGEATIGVFLGNLFTGLCCVLCYANFRLFRTYFSAFAWACVFSILFRSAKDSIIAFLARFPYFLPEDEVFKHGKFDDKEVDLYSILSSDVIGLFRKGKEQFQKKIKYIQKKSGFLNRTKQTIQILVGTTVIALGLFRMPVQVYLYLIIVTFILAILTLLVKFVTVLGKIPFLYRWFGCTDHFVVTLSIMAFIVGICVTSVLVLGIIIQLDFVGLTRDMHSWVDRNVLDAPEYAHIFDVDYADVLKTLGNNVFGEAREQNHEGGEVDGDFILSEHTTEKTSRFLCSSLGMNYTQLGPVINPLVNMVELYFVPDHAAHASPGAGAGNGTNEREEPVNVINTMLNAFSSFSYTQMSDFITGIDQATLVQLFVNPLFHMKTAVLVTALSLSYFFSWNIVFMTTFYYLLVAKQEIMHDIVSNYLRNDAKQQGSRVFRDIERVIFRTFWLPIKLACTNAALSFGIFFVFQVEYIYFSTASAFFLGALPFIPSYVVCLPWVAFYMYQGQFQWAILLSVTYVTTLSRVTYDVEAEKLGRKGLDAYMLLLSVVLGLSEFGIQGVLYGPMLFSLLQIMNHWFREFVIYHISPVANDTDSLFASLLTPWKGAHQRSNSYPPRELENEDISDPTTPLSKHKRRTQQHTSKKNR